MGKVSNSLSQILETVVSAKQDAAMILLKHTITQKQIAIGNRQNEVPIVNRKYSK